LCFQQQYSFKEKNHTRAAERSIRGRKRGQEEDRKIGREEEPEWKRR
jgi:hypothetical protein